MPTPRSKDLLQTPALFLQRSSSDPGFCRHLPTAVLLASNTDRLGRTEQTHSLVPGGRNAWLCDALRHRRLACLLAAEMASTADLYRCHARCAGHGPEGASAAARGGRVRPRRGKHWLLSARPQREPRIQTPPEDCRPSQRASPLSPAAMPTEDSAPTLSFWHADSLAAAGWSGLTPKRRLSACVTV